MVLLYLFVFGKDSVPLYCTQNSFFFLEHNSQANLFYIQPILESTYMLSHSLDARQLVSAFTFSKWSFKGPQIILNTTYPPVLQSYNIYGTTLRKQLIS